MKETKQDQFKDTDIFIEENDKGGRYCTSHPNFIPLKKTYSLGKSGDL